MEKVSKVIYGIKLVERTCTKCPLTFLVPESSKTLTCSEFCLEKSSKRGNKMRGRVKRKRFTDKIKEEDYA